MSILVSDHNTSINDNEEGKTSTNNHVRVALFEKLFAAFLPHTRNGGYMGKLVLGTDIGTGRVTAGLDHPIVLGWDQEDCVVVPGSENLQNGVNAMVEHPDDVGLPSENGVET